MTKAIRQTCKNTTDRSRKPESSLPLILLLVIIAAIAATCAGIVSRYASRSSYQWKDYDDSGLL